MLFRSWAFLYNTVAIPVAGGVFSFLNITLTPAIASACMSLSSLFVVGNALRIRAKKKKTPKTQKIKGVKIIYEISIERMHCNHCTGKVNDALLKMQGVNTVSVSLQNKTAIVESFATIAEQDFYSVIESLGFKVIQVKIV